MTDKPAREKATATIRTLITPTMRADFERWAATRDLSLSTALRLVIADVLSRDALTASEPAYRTLALQVHREPVAPSGAVWDASCGMFHDRALEPGERCPWAVDTSGAIPAAPYRALPA